jgi:2-polyprenyl-6-methoxyphenol hydroxylase-like FAD-dependent oxidoreductase
MSDYRNHIGIIGGGISGLTLGCALLKQGIPAIIFEKMPEETSHGAAISLSSNALRLLDRLEIYVDLKNQSFVHSAASIQGPQMRNILIPNTGGLNNTSTNINVTSVFSIHKSRRRDFSPS